MTNATIGKRCEFCESHDAIEVVTNRGQRDMACIDCAYVRWLNGLVTSAVGTPYSVKTLHHAHQQGITLP